MLTGWIKVGRRGALPVLLLLALLLHGAPGVVHAQDAAANDTLDQAPRLIPEPAPANPAPAPADPAAASRNQSMAAIDGFVGRNVPEDYRNVARNGLNFGAGVVDGTGQFYTGLGDLTSRAGSGIRDLATSADARQRAADGLSGAWNATTNLFSAGADGDAARDRFASTATRVTGNIVDRASATVSRAADGDPSAWRTLGEFTGENVVGPATLGVGLGLAGRGASRTIAGIRGAGGAEAAALTGERALVAGERLEAAAVTGERAVVGAERLEAAAVTGERAVVGAERAEAAALTGERAVVGAERAEAAALTGERAVVGAERAEATALTGERAVVGAERAEATALTGERAAVGAERAEGAAVTGERSAVAAEQGAVGAERVEGAAVTGERSAVAAEQGAAGAERVEGAAVTGERAGGAAPVVPGERAAPARIGLLGEESGGAARAEGAVAGEQTAGAARPAAAPQPAAAAGADGAATARAAEARVPLTLAPIDAAVADEAFPLVQRSYSQIGGSPYTSAEQLGADLRTTLVGRGTDGRMTAFAGAKETPFGRKYVILATDGSAEGTATMKQFLGELATGATPGYAELSGAPLAIVRKTGPAARLVTFEEASAVLRGKNIARPTAEELATAIARREIPNDPVHIAAAYARDLPGVGRHVKVMVGTPSLP